LPHAIRCRQAAPDTPAFRYRAGASV
jgi:hypothetical protein